MDFSVRCLFENSHENNAQDDKKQFGLFSCSSFVQSVWHSMEREFITQPTDHHGEVTGLCGGLVVTGDEGKIVTLESESKSATLAGLQIDLGETLYSFARRRERCDLVAQVDDNCLVTRSLSAVRHRHGNVNLAIRRHVF